MVSLRAARYRVKNSLWLQGYPCPKCWEPITMNDGEFHHALFREGAAFTEEQKAFLYDARNGTLVHHACHMDEGLQFRLNCAVTITQRAGGPKAILKFVDEYSALAGENQNLPPLWVNLFGSWFADSRPPCPTCHERTLHSYITGKEWLADDIREGTSKVICWNCLWRNW